MKGYTKIFLFTTLDMQRSKIQKFTVEILYTLFSAK